MLRFVLTAVLFLCALAPASYAQSTVKLRSGDHDGYARLVFDWGKAASYTLDESTPGKVIVKFTEAGTPDLSGLKDSNVSVISQSPLQVAIALPPGMKARGFSAGNRVIIDLYGGPPRAVKAQPPVKEAVKEPIKEPAKKPEPVKVAAEPKPVEAPKPVPAPEVALKQAPPAPKAAVEPVVGEDLVPPELAPGAKPKRRIANNLITVSSIDPVGLAVFERNHWIWMVNDKDDLLTAPQVSGPDAKFFTPMESFDLEGGKMFRLPGMEDAIIKGQGGGLLWRVIISSNPPKNPPVRPIRVHETEAEIKKPHLKPGEEPKKWDPARGATIVWPFEDARRIFMIKDPATGKSMFVVTVGSSKSYAGPATQYVDFETLDSPVGLVLLSKVDDLEVSLLRNGGVKVTRPGGLALTNEEKVAALQAAFSKQIKPGKQENAKKIFDFRNWQMGGLDAMDENRNVIMTSFGGLKSSDRMEGILTLAKMYLSNGMWAEAKGFLDLAADEVPELNQNAAYMALQGAAQALGWESEAAFELLSVDELKPYPEIGYWRAFALADLGDWQQADEVFPDELYILSEYPAIIRTKLSLVLAEVALRAGDTAKGEELLGLVEVYADKLAPQQQAALSYLKGEAARQRKKPEETKKLWKALTKGQDPLYRAKGGLALTRLLSDSKELKPEKALDNLERLRYAWRGDDLEAQIGYWLGRTYFDTKEYVKGLVIMHDAATFAEGTDIGKRITVEMTDVFKKLFLGPELDKVPAVDAAALHDQFAAYIPEGPEGDKIAQRLAERLVKADLLDRAAALLQNQLSRLDPTEGYSVAMRLAAINILDKKPGKALTILDQAAQLYPRMPEELHTEERALEIPLLRARALSEQDKSDQALALLKELPRGPEVNSLRADIAWRAGYWDEAAIALDDVILDRNVSLTRPLDADNTALLLQRAVALNLANDRVGLANMREKYGDVMAQTDKARMFEVVTRPRQSSMLADRQTLMGIVSEVDLFKAFLDGMKTAPIPATGADQAAAAPAAGAATEKPAETPAAPPSQ